MRILLDTNVVIHREANYAHNEDIGLLFNWIDKLHHEKCIHPYSLKEIENYKDKEVVRTFKIKTENYNILKTIAPDCKFIDELRKQDRNENDSIDTSILNELFKNRVNCIITEDRGLHRKAKALNVSHNVFTIDGFIEKCTAEHPDLVEYKILAARKKYFGNINLDDSFFDSFKGDYAEFEDWFNRKSDKESYICETDEGVKAFLFVKIEESTEIYKDITPEFLPKKRLKIGTFKVTSTGYKLGERFLKIIFDNAKANHVEEIYVTIFDKREEQKRLIELLKDWGFKEWGKKETDNGIECVLVRDFTPNVNKNNPRLSYPYIDRKSSKFIVPIYPQYHTDLLPDSHLRNERVENFLENAPHRNAIRKVYISRSLNRDIKRGDVILFYRTGGFHQSVTTTIGIVDSVYDNIRDEKEFISLCRKRSVFDDNELKKHWNYNKFSRPFVVNFLYIYSFPKRLNMAKLIELGIIEDVHSAPRGFEPISLEKFNTIIKESDTNESYFID